MSTKKHGNIVLSQNGLYLQTDAGEPFFWLADTWWYGLTDRTEWSTFEKLVNKRSEQGFTVIQLVVGVPPEVSINSQHTLSDGEAPFIAGHQPNPRYFDAVEKKIAYLVAKNLVPCLVGNWGNHLDQVGYQAMMRFWQMMIERCTQYPVVWCLTGEVDIVRPSNNSITHAFQKAEAQLSKFPTVTKILFGPWKKMLRLAGARALNQRLKRWSNIATLIKELDPNQHLLMVHPHSMVAGSTLLTDSSLLDIETIQSGHSHDRKTFLVNAAKTFSKTKPFINIEPWYEGILNDFGEKLQRYAFWMSVLSGAKGHSYGADGLWNMRTKDKFLDHWGTRTWQDALNLPGAEQLALAVRWLKQFDWWTLTPAKCFFPAWNEKQPDRPIGASTKEGIYICYFPDASLVSQIAFTPKGAWKNEYYSPQTLKRIKNLDSQDDLLLVVRQ